MLPHSHRRNATPNIMDEATKDSSAKEEKHWPSENYSACVLDTFGLNSWSQSDSSKIGEYCDVLVRRKIELWQLQLEKDYKQRLMAQRDRLGPRIRDEYLEDDSSMLVITVLLSLLSLLWYGLWCLSWRAIKKFKSSAKTHEKEKKASPAVKTTTSPRPPTPIPKTTVSQDQQCALGPHPLPPRVLIRLVCDHQYCSECLERLLRKCSLAEYGPAKCCGLRIPYSLVCGDVDGAIPQRFVFWRQRERQIADRVGDDIAWDDSWLEDCFAGESESYAAGLHL